MTQREAILAIVTDERYTRTDGPTFAELHARLEDLGIQPCGVMDDLKDAQREGAIRLSDSWNRPWKFDGDNIGLMFVSPC